MLGFFFGIANLLLRCSEKTKIKLAGCPGWSQEASDASKPPRRIQFSCWTIHLTVSHVSVSAGANAASVASAGTLQ